MSGDKEGEWKVAGPSANMWAQEIPGCLSTSMWGPVVPVLEEGGLPREYGKQWPLMALLLCQSEPFVIGLALPWMCAWAPSTYVSPNPVSLFGLDLR